MAVVVSIDAGTTGVRSFALNDNGEQVALAYQEFEQHYPRPGWVEHDATEIWRSVQITLSELMTAVEEPVAAVGIANQRETIVAWSRASSAPVARAIVW
ncbi:MAG: glycerol kinase, partial [Acidimicrobiales bacterium]|nr:glycerol kinase [Acidimicrobiales bacterium]